LSRVIRNIHVKLVFYREQDIDPVQRIDTQFGEGAVGRDLLKRHVLRIGDHFDHALRQFFVGHSMSVIFSK